MERIVGLLLVLIATLGNIHHVEAQVTSQEGFISLDCGLPATAVSYYTEEKTRLRFSSDAKYIQSGESGIIQSNFEIPLKPYTTLRYFPQGIRNCYNLPVEKDRIYLIKAWFRYGNYDGFEIIPNFDLYLGPNLWATVNMQKVGNNGSTFEEILHIPTSNKLQICLVKTGETTPLISSLELRPMGNDSYITKSGSLKLLSRRYISNSTNYIRYPEDAYDRQWFPTFQPEWTLISATNNVGNSNAYMAPKDVLKNAATPSNTSASLTIEWSSDNPDDQYYAYEYLAEIQDLQANETRELIVSLNGEPLSKPVIPTNYLITMQSVMPRKCEGGKCSLQLARTLRSTLPPLLNAYEIYRVIQFVQPETNENEVVAITSIKETYILTRINWQGDPCVPKHLMWDGLNCSDTIISTSPKITSLNLASSGLTGTIADAIQNLTHLENLDLSNNTLIGELPEFLGNMKSLLFINLSGNDLNGSIPQALQRKGVELVLLPGNPRLCHTGSCAKPPSKKFPVAIVAYSVASVAILIAALVLFLVLRKKKLHVEDTTPEVLPIMFPMVNVTRANSLDPLIEMKRRRFAYSDVVYMTNNFQRVLGKGGFGQVYHGTINESEQVAVKVLSQSSSQGSKQFKAEVDLLLRVHHTNLVSLVGYCDEEDHLALIYEFVPNGDLKEHLSGKDGRPIINWAMRLRIAAEAALGLEYLHTGCTPPMVHRDVKTANREHFKAKIADFGLSRSFPIGDESNIWTMIAGTPGYLDPEYYQTGRLSEKSDVYSFGIVLLEMITNQPVIDQTRKNFHIKQWAGTALREGDITKIIDANLREGYDSRSAWRALELAMSCTNPSSSRRPDMSQVVIELKGCLVCENSRGDMNMGSEIPVGVSVSIDTEMLPMPR